MATVFFPVAVGCTSLPAPTTEPYWIAMRYDVEPCLVTSDEETAWKNIESDFRAIAALGFDTVVLHHVDDGDRITLLDRVSGVGLKAFVPDRRIEHFVRTGSLPVGCSDAAATVRTIPREVTRHPAYAGLAIGTSDGAEPLARAAQVGAILSRQRSNSALVLGGPTGETHGGDLAVGATTSCAPAVVGARVQFGQSGGSPTPLWLGQYHGALGAGRTTALVFDRYRRPPGDPAGLVPATGAIGPAAAAAIDALVLRARHWGARLRGLSAHPLSDVRIEGAQLLVTGFSAGPRRYVFVVNETPDSYAHGEVGLPAVVNRQGATRAVEVPASDAQPAGRVVRARAGRIRLPVDLRPGDAVLFEVF